MIARFVCLLPFPLSLKLVSNKHFHIDFLDMARASSMPPPLQNFILMTFVFYRTLLASLEVEKCGKMVFFIVGCNYFNHTS